MEKISIDKLNDNPNNPRTLSDEDFKKLVKSISDFPEMLELRPIVVDETLTVLGGNMRLKACRELKMSKVPIIRAKDLTDEQKREFVIKDNVSAGKWDWDNLANEWDQNTLVDWGMDSFHFGASASVLNPFMDEPDTEPVDDPSVVHKITDEGFARFEIVVPEENKHIIIKTIKEIRDAEGCNSAQAFMKVFTHYANTKT